jgi:putative tryptophan/tyrosine transport system substrate-binding protein
MRRNLLASTRFRGIAVLGLLVSFGTAAHARDTIGILSSGREAPYLEVVEVLRARMVGAGVDLVEVDDGRAMRQLQPRIALAVGTNACRALAQEPVRVAVLCTLLPKAAFDRVVEELPETTGRVAAQYLDQPLSRQLDLIRIALPGRRRVGVLLGPDAAFDESTLRTLAAQQGLQAVAVRVTESGGKLSSALQDLLMESDVLLAIPDRSVFNSRTIQSILHLTVQRRIPVVGFSPAYTKAGATLALYTTPAMVGAQTARVLRRALAGDGTTSSSPADFEVEVNEAVARSMGLDLEPAAVLKVRLQNSGAKP